MLTSMLNNWVVCLGEKGEVDFVHAFSPYEFDFVLIFNGLEEEAKKNPK